MAKTKIYKSGWWNAPNAFFVAAMRTTDQRNAEVETANQQWIAARQAFHTAFTTLDDAYQKSLMSFSSKTIAEKDDERDIYGQVLEQVSQESPKLSQKNPPYHERYGGFFCDLLGKLSHHHIEYHHQDKADGETDGAEIGVFALAGFWNEFLDDDIEHGACGKGQQIG